MDQTLTESNLLPDPIEQFTRWYDDVKERNVELYNAMTLATADASGIPSARMLLLKGFDKKGFVFYTNYTSSKARELEQNPRACIVFYWKEVDRQVRIWGNVERVSRQESEAYFKTRPYDSQLGAWASHQSAVIPAREILEKRFNELRDKYPEGDVPLPEFWGGYRMQPEAVEFWQGRSSRLHDRIKYTKKENEWETVRLAP
jgi:pyridoxamine 5'-phosphate oxidase